MIMSTRPAPIHELWRITYELTGVPGRYVALKMVSRPHPAMSRLIHSNGHSKCAISRRSILSITLRAPLLLQAKERGEHFAGHGGSHGTTAPFGMLDQRRHRDLRIFHRCICDEPRVIALLPR